MRTYADYCQEVLDDSKGYIEGNIGYIEDEDDLFEQLWVSDSVTGNGSGSYFCNSYRAREACSDLVWDDDFLCAYRDNWGGEGLAEALEQGPELFDVLIRCIALYDVINEANEYFKECAREGDKN